MVGKVALAAVVGNEDGAHKIVADLFQALNDIGFSIAAQGCTYWNGEAMQGTDYTDLDDVPDAVASATANAARNAVHLATVLRQNPLSGIRITRASHHCSWGTSKSTHNARQTSRGSMPSSMAWAAVRPSKPVST